LVIGGAGPAGVNAALEAGRLGLSCVLLEAAEPFATIAAFPVAKPIFTYPRALTPAGSLRLTADVKEPLLEELRSQVAGLEVRHARAERVERDRGALQVVLEGGDRLRARRVLVVVGRSGDFRRLGVPGESQGHVSNRLHDPGAFAGRSVLVVGGGDSACEAAIALAAAGAGVTLAHRGADLARAKPENAERVRALAGGGSLALVLGARVTRIGERDVTLADAAGETTRAADAVFVLIGRRPPLDFLRRCGVEIAGERTPAPWLAMAAFMLFCAWLYNWKSGGFFSDLWSARHWFPTDIRMRLAALGGAVAAQAADPRTLLGTLAVSAASPAFWYTLAYSIVIVVFGLRRIRRRRTPYVTAQTLTLMLVQVLPLFLLPEVILPLLRAHG